MTGNGGIHTDREKKKKAAGIAVAFATGISLVIGGLFQSPADLAQDPTKAISPPAYELVLPDLPDNTGNGGDDGEDDAVPEEKKRGGLRSALRERILRLPWGVRAFAGVPVWAFGFILLTGLSALWSAVLSPVMGTIIGWICVAAVILAIIFCTVKAAFPNIPVRKILNRKTIPAVVFGVALISVADSVIPLISSDPERIRNIFRICSTGLLTVCVTVPKLIRCKAEHNPVVSKVMST